MVLRPGWARGNNQNVATTKSDEEPGAEKAKAVAEKNESAAALTKINSLISSDFARALAHGPAPKIATVNP